MVKIYFDCERCGQPFDLEINPGDFKCSTLQDCEGSRECLYEYKKDVYCCGNDIQLKIYVRQGHDGDGDPACEILHKGLRNFRDDGNLNALARGLIQNYALV